MSVVRPNRHELIRRHNEGLVLECVGAAEMPISRAAIAESTGLSRPTVNLLVDELCAGGLLRDAGTRTGVVGRPASLIEVNPDFGSVAAIAIDASGVSVLVADLNGRVRSELRAQLPMASPIGEPTLTLLQRAIAESGIDPGSLLALTVSEPGVDAPAGVTRALAPNLPELDDAEFARMVNERLGASSRFDNDVNLAAVGERRFGVVRGEDSFVFLLVDAGIGMGLMVNGEILRGAHGAAGEAGYLPVGDAPLSGRAARVGALELQAGEDAFVERFRSRSGDAQASLSDIWERARSGDAVALEEVRQEADLIGRAVLSAVALVDPAYLVLGGSIGGNPLVHECVVNCVAEIAPFPVAIRSSALGGRAALLGALATALDQARTELGLPEAPA